jgi:hypothetical protein
LAWRRSSHPAVIGTRDEERGTNCNEERGILRLPDEGRGSFSPITSTRNEG